MYLCCHCEIIYIDFIVFLVFFVLSSTFVICWFFIIYCNCSILSRRQDTFVELTLVVRVTEIAQDGFVIPIEKLRKGLCPGAKLDIYFPGFPTLKHLKHTVLCSE